MQQHQVDEGPWWETGVLSPEHHMKLVQNRLAIARRAGLGEKNLEPIWTKLPCDVTEREREWARAARTGEKTEYVGPLYLGKEAAALRRIQALTGAMLRNFIDARILSCQQITQMIMDKEPIEASVLFIPDLAAEGVLSSMTPAVRKMTLNLIADRVRMRQPTGLYAPNKKALGETLGMRMAELIAPEVFSVELK